MNKLLIVISSVLALFANNAFADVIGCPGPSDPNALPCHPIITTDGSCSVVASSPGSLAALMVTVGFVALVISRKRR